MDCRPLPEGQPSSNNRPRRRAHGRRSFAAFTLLELLVTIAIIAVVAGLLLPGLAGAKSRAQLLDCQNSHRQLGLAWILYAGDHRDTLPYNFGAAETRATVARGEYLNWVNNVLDWELRPENTNASLNAIGGLGPYTGGEVRLYRCPRDWTVSDLQREAGWRHRVRSRSMNALVGDAGEFTASGDNVNVPQYTQFFRLAEIPEPSRIFVFLDEHPDSINDGYFLNRPALREWNDLPGSYHDGATALAFADGHVESRRWEEPGTCPPARPDTAALPRALQEGEGRDFYWLLRRMSVREYTFASQ